MIGLAYLMLALYRMALSERLCFGLREGKIERALGAWRWQVPFRTGQLSVEVEEGLLSSRGRLTLEARASAQYVEVQTLLVGHDLAEKRWVAARINEWIAHGASIDGTVA
jgi:hypothetical protein